jgi:hypothetical protein
MFKQPQHSNTFARIALSATLALLVFQLMAAANMTRVELRCGAACQQVVTGREF